MWLEGGPLEGCSDDVVNPFIFVSVRACVQFAVVHISTLRTKRVTLPVFGL